jgi:hypothetical protein
VVLDISDSTAFIFWGQIDELTLENEGRIFFKMSGTIHPKMQWHVAEDKNPQLYHCENLTIE